jgi:hypothetical protein
LTGRPPKAAPYSSSFIAATIASRRLPSPASWVSGGVCPFCPTRLVVEIQLKET